MTKLWLGKVGALFRINKKRDRVSHFFDTASFYNRGLCFIAYLLQPESFC